MGGALSYADLALWMQILELSEHDNIPSWAEVWKEELPALSRHYTTISQLPRLRAYLSSDRIMPRNKLVTEPERKYVFVRGVGSVPPPDSPAAKGEL